MDVGAIAHMFKVCTLSHDDDGILDRERPHRSDPNAKITSAWDSNCAMSSSACWAARSVPRPLLHQILFGVQMTIASRMGLGTSVSFTVKPASSETTQSVSSAQERQ